MSHCLNLSEFGTMIVGWLLTAGIWFHFIIIVVCEPDLSNGHALCRYYSYGGETRNFYFFVPLVIAYLLSFFLILIMPTKKYLTNIIDTPVTEYERRLFRARPTCLLEIECYHYDECVKRVTNRQYEEFKISSFRSHCAVGAEYSKAMRLRISKNLTFQDSWTKSAHKKQLHDLTYKYSSDNSHKTVSNLKIPGCRGKYALAFSDPADRPFWYSMGFYYLCVFLTLGMPYVTYFHWSTKAVDLVVTKEVSMIEYGAVVDNAPRTINYNDEPIEYV